MHQHKPTQTPVLYVTAVAVARQETRLAGGITQELTLCFRRLLLLSTCSKSSTWDFQGYGGQHTCLALSCSLVSDTAGLGPLGAASTPRRKLSQEEGIIPHCQQRHKDGSTQPRLLTPRFTVGCYKSSQNLNS